ncbi:type II toxin-antitoxin system antitoxin SocA domain-containing protein [Promicromonospora sp. NPDC023805]|uniref:Panacea domain-containing protein n=1 Tax=Promicromonospora sp. NPDC023805 TaxID=3154696 RepID=UPI0033DF7A7A
MFDSEFQAWANGPVCWDLYNVHRGLFSLGSWTEGDQGRLTDDEASSVRSVLAFYDKMSAHELSELTHREAAWLDARKGLAAGARSSVVITQASMHEYYDGLTSASQ